MVKFNKFNVANGTDKARVHYSHGFIIGGRECVTIYAKDYGHALGRVFAGSEEYQNDTDSQTDYFDKGRVRIFPDSPLWSAALARCA
jgi:hypothetical protein